MCRAATSSRGARRCPAQADPVLRAQRNERRRAKYAMGRNTGQKPSPDVNTSDLDVPFVSALRKMSFDEAQSLVFKEEYEQYEHNPYVKRLYGADGSSMLYVPIDNLQAAITNDVYDYGLGYRLLGSDHLGKIKSFCSPMRLKELEASLEAGDPMDQGYVVRNILYDKFNTIADGVDNLMEDNRTAYELRQRCFNHFGHEEYTIRNDDNTVAGYAFTYQGKNPVTLDEMNPSLVRSPDDSDGFKEYMWAKNTVEGIFQADSEAYDVQVRNEYFTEVEKLVKKYGYPKRGAYRMVFDCGDTVIKIPLNADGLTDNAGEAGHSKGKVKDYHEGVPIAPCKLEYTERGMPYLVMEKVDMVDIAETEKPEWSKLIDNFQLGRSRVTGELVAYDL